MEQLRGFVSHIIYRNEENAYTVFELNLEGDLLTCTGTAPSISEGESCEVTGEFRDHPVYGQQLRLFSYHPCAPESREAMYRYLSSGAIKGIGESLAARIIRTFGEDTLRILDEEPERLSEVKGISDRMAREIAAQTREKQEVRSAMMFLQQYGITNQKALRIWQTYGMEMYTVFRENPYRLAEDVDGIGFAMADELAQRMGIRADSEFRIRSAVQYVLSSILQEGSTFLPQEELTGRTAAMLGLEEDLIRVQIDNLAIERKIILRSRDGVREIYLASAFYEERNIALRLRELLETGGHYRAGSAVRGRIREIENQTGIELDELQKKAVELGVGEPVVIISGGPGTGKTTAINTIIRYFESEGKEVLLAAPTGRAARRMTEATGCEAMTIHRLLGVRVIENSTGRAYTAFEKDESSPLEADAVIVDEVSMADIYLFHALLKGIMPGTSLILVGDVNQLPSVGPGQVLRDLIESKAVPTVMLRKIFRQAAESDIVMNAHRILEGEELVMDNHSRDFFFLERNDVPPIYKHMVQLIRENLPGYVHCSEGEIQVLTPMKKGALGAQKLNEVLQSVLNPPEEGKPELQRQDVIFRVGDKVMQTRNNYQIEWEIRGRYGIPLEKGTGIFNGDFGVIREIDERERVVTVCFDENRIVSYPFSELEDLDLAYAITVHKSQGSEYPAVILPILSGPPALMNRNLLYTAVTRARSCVVLLGSSAAVRNMAKEENRYKRNTGLEQRIRELGNTGEGTEPAFSAQMPGL